MKMNNMTCAVFTVQENLSEVKGQSHRRGSNNGAGNKFKSSFVRQADTSDQVGLLRRITFGVRPERFWQLFIASAGTAFTNTATVT